MQSASCCATAVWIQTRLLWSCGRWPCGAASSSPSPETKSSTYTRSPRTSLTHLKGTVLFLKYCQWTTHRCTCECTSCDLKMYVFIKVFIYFFDNLIYKYRMNTNKTLVEFHQHSIWTFIFLKRFIHLFIYFSDTVSELQTSRNVESIFWPTGKIILLNHSIMYSYMYKCAVKTNCDSPVSSGAMHREKRQFLRVALKELCKVLEDEPGLLGPKVEELWET